MPTHVPTARDLTHLLPSSTLGAFAIAEPERPETFVALVYVPEPLLLIEAIHPFWAVLDGRIKAHEYREAYFDLQATPARHGRLFIWDAGADGLLLPAPGHRRGMVDDGQGRPCSSTAIRPDSA